MEHVEYEDGHAVGDTLEAYPTVGRMSCNTEADTLEAYVTGARRELTATLSATRWKRIPRQVE